MDMLAIFYLGNTYVSFSYSHLSKNPYLGTLACADVALGMVFHILS